MMMMISVDGFLWLVEESEGGGWPGGVWAIFFFLKTLLPSFTLNSPDANVDLTTSCSGLTD